MKKTYEAPSVEKVAFQYRDQVVVASGNARCYVDWDGENSNANNCNTDNVYHGDTDPSI